MDNLGEHFFLALDSCHLGFGHRVGGLKDLQIFADATLVSFLVKRIVDAIVDMHLDM